MNMKMTKAQYKAIIAESVTIDYIAGLIHARRMIERTIDDAQTVFQLQKLTEKQRAAFFAKNRGR